MSDEVLTVPEVMVRLKVGRSTVYDLIRSRRLKSIKIGRCRRIPAASLDNYLTEQLAEAA
jgi:excisionase family DNA binding protein